MDESGIVITTERDGVVVERCIIYNDGSYVDLKELLEWDFPSTDVFDKPTWD